MFRTLAEFSLDTPNIPVQRWHCRNILFGVFFKSIKKRSLENYIVKTLKYCKLSGNAGKKDE